MTIEQGRKLKNNQSVLWYNKGSFYPGTVKEVSKLGVKIKWTDFTDSSLFLFDLPQVWENLAVVV